MSEVFNLSTSKQIPVNTNQKSEKCTSLLIPSDPFGNYRFFFVISAIGLLSLYTECVATKDGVRVTSWLLDFRLNMVNGVERPKNQATGLRFDGAPTGVLSNDLLNLFIITGVRQWCFDVFDPPSVSIRLLPLRDTRDSGHWGSFV